MKKIVLFTFLIFCIPVFSQTTSPVTKIAAYNMDSVLDRMPEMKKAAIELENYEKSLSDQILKMENDVAVKKHEYDSLKSSWSPLICGLKQKEINDLDTNIAVFKKQSVADFETRRKELVEPIIAKVEDAAFAVAKEKGCSKVIDTSTTDPKTVYGRNTICIYEDVCRKLGLAK